VSWKSAAGVLLGLTPTDAYFLKSVRHSRWLRHFYRLPLTKFDAPALPPVDEEDRALARRIIAFFERASEAGDHLAQRSPMWDRNLASLQSPLVAALRAADEEALAELLHGFLRNRIIRGIDAGDSYTRRNWRIHSLKLLDALVSLAEQLAVVRAESRQGKAGIAFAERVEQLVERIEDRVGFPIGAPAVGGPYGLRVGDRLIAMNTPEYVYVAWRLREAVQRYCTRGLEVLEIGAGYGATAYHFLRLVEVERYTIVDLPEIAALHAYYLGKCLGADAISLYGEDEAAKVRIIPPHALAEVASASLVFNQDSLPEIPAEAASGYIEWIRDHVTGIFFSYNHETILAGGQFAVTSVPEIVAQVGGLERVSRDLSWSRPGYVEEVYRPSAKTQFQA
jgi:putative sugar O-methyltransferase